MDHTEAIQGKFAEQYLLGELTPVMRDRFEEHFFDCAICTGDLQAGAVFIDNARLLLAKELYSEEAAPLVKSAVFFKYGAPFQAAAWAFIVVLCVAGYENIVTIPGLKSRSGSGALPAVSLIGMGSRAESRPRMEKAGKNFVVEFEIPGGPEFSSYVAELSGNNGMKFITPVSARQAKNTVRLTMPGSVLSAGNYRLVAFGVRQGQAQPQELSRYAIVLVP